MELDQYIFWVYTGFFLNVIVFSILMYSLLLRFVKTLGVRDSTNLIRWSSEKKPAIGGIGFFIVFLFSAGSYGVFFDPQDVFKNTEVLGVMAFTSLSFLMGLADDAYDTKPILKFGVQLLCAVGCILTGVQINIFESEALNMGITILWVTGIMNSINMLDNMDAITGSTSLLICLNILIVLNVSNLTDSFDFYLILGVVGSLIGFLYFNWHPSKMFMGDTGSQFLGFFLAAMGIKYLWNAGDVIDGIAGNREFIMVVLAFLLPLTDTTTVVISRIASRKSPFIGGKDHTTHNLSYAGLSESQVVFAFIGIGVMGLLGNFAITAFPEYWNITMLLGFSSFILLVFIPLCLYSLRNNLRKLG